MAQYVYLLQTSKFVESRQPIYKIGRTTQSNFKRFGNYEKGFVMLFQSSCRDCVELEKQIIILFRSRYVWRNDCGHEYFEGDQLSMMGDLCDIVRNERVTQGEGVEVPMQDDNDSNDTNNDVRVTQDTPVSNAVVEGITEYVAQDAIVLDENENEDDIESEEEVSVMSNTNEDQDDTENDTENGVVELLASVQKMLNCIPCGISTNNRYNYAKHLKTQKHKDRMQNPEDYAFECINCFKTYNTKLNLRNHQRRYRAPRPIIPPVLAPLGTEVDDLEGITRETSFGLDNCNIN